MKMKLCIICVLLMWCGGSYAQNFTNKGRDFWTGYALHYFMEPAPAGDTFLNRVHNTQEMVLYFSAEEDAKVTVVTNGRVGSKSKIYFVKGGTAIASDPMPKTGNDDCTLFELPPPFGNGGEGVFNRSIHIYSDVPIVAYAHISGEGSSGATMLMPTESWGYSYMSVNSQQKVILANANCFNWLLVVANHNGTKVEITPSAPLRGGRQAGMPFTATLDSGQIYQIVGAALDQYSGYDLTGTKVKSVDAGAGDCYPIGVFAGSSSTEITCSNSNSFYADNLIQQLFPVQAWGKRYLTAPFSSSNGATELNSSTFRIAVRDPATIVKKNGTALALSGLKNNFYYEYQSGTADYVEADKPISVTQYIPSMGYTYKGTVFDPGCGYKGLGDPEMVILSPIEQSINQVGFYRNTAAAIEVNYLTLIIPTAGLTSLTIDGSNNFSYNYPHPNLPGYTVVVQRWPAAKAQCIVKSDSLFTAVTYGLGSFDSYAYNAGTKINNLNGSLNLHNTEGTPGVVHPFTCPGSPVELSILMAYQPTQMLWHLDQLTHISPNANVFDPSPVAAGTVVNNGITYYKYVLPTAYRFDTTGTFRFTVSTTHPSVDNCNNTEHLQLDVVVKKAPHTEFTYTHTGCKADPVEFAWKTGSAGTFNIKKWLWTFPDATVAATETTQKQFTTSGTKNVQLQITSEEGCIGDTTQPIPVYDAPSIGFTATPAVVCDGDKVTLNATTPPGANLTIKEWYWDLGNGTTFTNTDRSVKDIAYAVNNSPYTAKLVAKVSAACISDTARQTIVVNALPVGNITLSKADICLGDAVTLSSQVQPANTITNWSWDLGDGQKPTYTNGNAFPYTYAAAKSSYTVKLIVTDNKGCKSKEAALDANVHALPVPAFTLPTRVCMPGEAVVTNQTTGAAPFTWQWNMGDGSAAITTKDAHHEYTTVGNYSITLAVKDMYGCAATAAKTLPATAFGSKPAAKFTIVPAEVCEGTPQKFTDQSTATNGTSISTWKWDFADGGSTSAERNPTKTFAEPGTYTVTLTVTDAAGCASDTYPQDAIVHVQPVVNTGGKIIVQKGKPVTFDVTANNTTDVNFTWAPADELINANTLRPTYSAAHDQLFTITATSKEGNCTVQEPLEVKVLVTVTPPNIFTPNSDGVNDFWVIDGLADYKACSVQVFNRYGQLVYRSAGYSKAWNGTFKGQPVPSGTYYYIITDPTSDWQRITGSVTIIR